MSPLSPVRAITVPPADFDPVALVEAGEPVICKGLVGDWPIVAAGKKGAHAAIQALKRFDGDRPVTAFIASAAIGGRFFYNDDLTGLNFAATRIALSAFLDRIAQTFEQPPEAAEALYIGSTDLDRFLPGFRAQNDLGLDVERLGGVPLASIWAGNRTIAPTHYDMSNNIACCLVGRRRFTLFPPDQVANLYPGPLEPTPAGQVVSMVDPRDPDLDRYPRFADALARARIADLEPGDVLVYPALWWHQVEARDAFNVMVNYWWNASPSFMDTPMNTILHGILSLRDRPASEKQAWRALFDHYLFGSPDRASSHLPPHARGPLAPLDEMAARRLRAQLIARLQR